MLTDHGVSALLNAQVEVAAGVAYITYIARISYKFIRHKNNNNKKQ